MREEKEKLGLITRTALILRTDRQALRLRQHRTEAPGGLLLITPPGSGLADGLDRLLPALARESGLEYRRLTGGAARSIPADLTGRSLLVVADLTGRDERTITLVYQAMAVGARILLCGESAADFPPDLEGLQRLMCRPGDWSAVVEACRSGAPVLSAQ